MRREQGFTLIEMLTAIGLAAILMTLAAAPLRDYWLTQGLYGAQQEVVNQLRQVQERTVSESNPLVYGVRFKVGSSTIGTVRYDPRISPATCTELGTFTLEAGTVVTAASFQTITSPAITSLCQTSIPGASSDRFALFFARGSATSGSVTLNQPNLGSKTLNVEVSPITGRVTKS